MTKLEDLGMSGMPAQPSIYHITHVDNLPSIVAQGGLLSDAAMAQGRGPAAAVGMDRIKERRMSLLVPCHPGTCVGEYVPFYFCPRSIMLYVLHRGNNPGLAYRGGQEPIVHLEADLYSVIHWATSQGRPWAFSLSNAGASYAEFRNDPSCLGELNWTAIAATDFRDRLVKDGKQAELLVQGSFPWHLVTRAGVCSARTATRVLTAIAGAHHRPVVEVRREWYF
jgi:hypothetical protein